jgi:hypothetical protein
VRANANVEVCKIKQVPLPSQATLVDIVDALLQSDGLDGEVAERILEATRATMQKRMRRKVDSKSDEAGEEEADDDVDIEARAMAQAMVPSLLRDIAKNEVDFLLGLQPGGAGLHEEDCDDGLQL